METDQGYRRLNDLRAREERAGYRSSFNFVPRRYEVADRMVADLKGAGFEVGVHGLYHDGHDLESRERLMERLPAIRDYADRWGATGFRSPATHRRWEWMGLLGFDYDSSFPDTDPYEPQPGGCCSWHPFFIDDLVELPITLPQDHTLFEILRHADASVWSAKAGLIRDRGGMALILTHPDYMTDERLVLYEGFLAEFADDATAWKALPSQVSAWWRRRDASRLERVGDEWRVIGPAAEEAGIRMGQPG